MIKKSSARLFVLSIVFLFSISVPSKAQDIPRWEDFYPTLTGNRIDDVVYGQGIWVLSSNNLFKLDQEQQYIKIDEAEDIQPDYLEVDANDNIWLASGNNFQFNGNHLAYATYKNGVLTSVLREDLPGFPNDNSSNGDNISCLFIDEAGIIWFGFYNGDVGKIDPSNSQYTHYSNTVITGYDVRDMDIDVNNGDLYVLIYANAYKLSSSGYWSIVTGNWANTSYLEAIDVYGPEEFVFGGYNGLHQYNAGIVTNVDIGIDAPIISDIDSWGTFYNIVCRDLNGVDYVQSLGEIIYTGISKSTNVYGFKSKFTTVLGGLGAPLINIFLGTEKDGFVTLNSSSWQPKYYNNETIGLPLAGNDQVNKTTFVGDLGYVATDGGLTIKRDSLFEGLHPYFTSPTIDILGDGKTNDVVYDGIKYVYIATDSGLSILDVATKAVQNFLPNGLPFSPEDVIHKVIDFKNGKVAAIGNNFFLLFENGNLLPDYFDLNASGLPYGYQWNKVIPEYTGQTLVGFWLASSSGLYYSDFSTSTNYNSDIYHQNVTAMAEGPDGKLWLGFDYYGDVIQTFDKVDQWDEITLPDIAPSSPDEQSIVDLEFDYTGTLWILAQYKTCSTCETTKLLEYKNDAFTIIDKQFQISDYSNDLAISPTGEKWISSRDGLHVYVDDSYSNLDPCLVVNCPEGTECVDGSCEPVLEGCEGVSCPEGEICYGGACFTYCATDNCLDLGPNLVANAGSSVELDAGAGYEIYEWSTGETTQSILVNASGQYWVIAYDTDAEVYSTDTINILIEANPISGCPDGMVDRDGYCFEPDDGCDGITCADGQVCYSGSCYDVCLDNNDPDCFEAPPCESVICPEGKECVDGSCVPSNDACNGVTCPEGFGCFEGSCYPICSDTEVCDPNNICYNDLCIPTEVACSVITCPEGFGCFEGSCYPICSDTEVCDPNNICYNDLCIPTEVACSVITCPEGFGCFEGSCYPICSDTEVCDPNNICYNNVCIPEDVVCENIQCSEGQNCRGGSCYDLCPSGGCVELGPNLIVKSDASIELDVGEGYDIVEWSTGETTQSILVNSSGQYWVIAYDTDAEVYSTDTVNILIEANPVTGCPDGLVDINGYCFPPTDACDGITCPEGQYCYEGSCFDPYACIESCDAGDDCFADDCYQQATCEGVVCDAGLVCKGGNCFWGCGFDTDCPEGYVCAVDVCVPPEYACDYTDCPEGNLCVYGDCYPYNPFNDNILNLSGTLLGENISGGRVAENAPISGATIYLFNESQTEINGFVTTGADGTYDFEKLRPGTYKVFVDYAPYKVKGDGLIVLKPNIKYTNLDIVLVNEEYELRLAYVTGLAEDFANRSIFTLYPNPSNGKIMISTKEAIGPVNIRISDITGRMLQQINMTLPKSEEIYITDLEGEAAGLKIIEIYQKGQLIHRSSLVLSSK